MPSMPEVEADYRNLFALDVLPPRCAIRALVHVEGTRVCFQAVNEHDQGSRVTEWYETADCPILLRWQDFEFPKVYSPVKERGFLSRMKRWFRRIFF